MGAVVSGGRFCNSMILLPIGSSMFEGYWAWDLTRILFICMESHNTGIYFMSQFEIFDIRKSYYNTDCYMGGKVFVGTQTINRAAYCSVCSLSCMLKLC